MITVFRDALNAMTPEERKFCEIQYLDLAYAYNYEMENRDQGSVAMSRNTTSLFKYTRAERKLLSSFKDLFDLSKDIHDRTGFYLCSIASKKDRTAKNALNTWRYIYFEIEKMKNAEQQ